MLGPIYLQTNQTNKLSEKIKYKKLLTNREVGENNGEEELTGY